MKKVLLISMVALVFAACETKTNGGSTSDLERYERLYNRAIKFEDYQTAAVALNHLLLDDTANMVYTDSLARIYLRGGKIDAGLELGQKVMDGNPKNFSLLELIALGQSYNGDYASAYKNFNTLHKELNDPTYLFSMGQVAIYQQNISRALELMDKVIADSGTGTFEAATASGGTQTVDIKAGALLFKAQYAFQQNDAQNGVDFLQKALQVAPDYQEAMALRQQLAAYQQQAAGAGVGQVPNAGTSSSSQARKAQQEAQQYEEWKKKNGKN
ncbi:MAG: hypothetical protein JJ975_09125 [Bacteroidia bacterium]|nr:hypothetical protein [Bacteroidia bacterium]